VAREEGKRRRQRPRSRRMFQNDGGRAGRELTPKKKEEQRLRQQLLEEIEEELHEEFEGDLEQLAEES